MPRGWLAVSTGTPPELEPYRDDPRGLERYVRAVVEGAGARFEALYFDVDRPVAYALVEGLDDFISIKAVRSILGAVDLTKLITVDQAADDAVRREHDIRGRLPH
jgi:hypothetical protein